MRIHRYILKEISTPALLSLLIFTFVLLMGRIPTLTELVVSKGIPVADILQLFGYLLPTFLSITLSLAFLLGILLAFGRLSAESEFVALKASGVSLYTLLKPVLLVAVCCSLLTGWITISVEPAGKTAFRSKLFQIVSSRASVGIRPGVFNDDFSGIVLYSRAMDERRGIMQGVLISDERNGGIPATILAREGRFISDPQDYRLSLRLSDGSIHRRPVGEEKAIYQIINFSSYDITLDMGQQLADGDNRYRSRGELSWRELEAAAASETDERSRFRYEVEKNKRIAIAFAPLVFALVGVPLGLQSHRSGKGAGFALSLAISLSYYLLLSVASTLAGKGTISAAPALWLPNLCFLIGGGYFIHRTAIEKPLALFALPARILSRLRRTRHKERQDG